MAGCEWCSSAATDKIRDVDCVVYFEKEGKNPIKENGVPPTEIHRKVTKNHTDSDEKLVQAFINSPATPDRNSRATKDEYRLSVNVTPPDFDVKLWGTPKVLSFSYQSFRKYFESNHLPDGCCVKLYIDHISHRSHAILFYSHPNAGGAVSPVESGAHKRAVRAAIRKALGHK